MQTNVRFEDSLRNSQQVTPKGHIETPLDNKEVSPFGSMANLLSIAEGQISREEIEN